MDGLGARRPSAISQDQQAGSIGNREPKRERVVSRKPQDTAYFERIRAPPHRRADDDLLLDLSARTDWSVDDSTSKSAIVIQPERVPLGLKAWSDEQGGGEH